MATERRDFTQDEIEEAWNKADVAEGNNPDIFRKDYAGAWIRKSDYGNRNSEYGWEVDHLCPLSMNGTYDIGNLYPLHWKNNLAKADNFPDWKTTISSEGSRNVEFVRSWYLK